MRLRFFQNVVKVGVFAGHFGQDIVGRAVDDAQHFLDAVAGQRVFHRLNDGDAARHAALELKVQIAPRRLLHQLKALLGDHLLVGRDDLLAVLQGALNELMGRVNAADQFAHDVNVGIVQNLIRVRGQQGAGHLHGAGLANIAHGDLLDDKRQADFALDVAPIAFQQGHRSGADHAQAQDADFNMIFVPEGETAVHADGFLCAFVCCVIICSSRSSSFRSSFLFKFSLRVSEFMLCVRGRRLLPPLSTGAFYSVLCPGEGLFSTTLF